MAIDPSIAMGYRGLGELPNPMNQLAQVSQIQSSQRQGEMAQMQIQQMRRDETALTQFYADVAKNGGPTNPEEIENAMINSGVRDIVNSGLTARMTRSKLENQQKQFAGIMGARMPTGAPMVAPDLAQGNALMPTPRASAPSVNALGGGGANNAAEIAFKQQQRDALIGMGTTQSIAAAKAIDADIALLAREPSYQNVPGVGLVNPRNMSVVMPSVESTDPVIKQYNLAVSQGFKGSILDYKREIARAGRAPVAPRPEAAPRTQQVTMANGTLGIMNMDTGAITPATMGGAPVRGKPSAFAEKNAAQRKQMGTDLGFAITQLADITKDGGLIDQSTGSGAGRLTDIAAGFVGEATPGAIAIGKIAPIADLALKMVPRFEGPQSNADTRSYKEAAGQLADSTLPTKIRKEAGKVVLRIMQTRKNQFATSDMAAEGAPSGGNVVDYGELK